METPILFSGLLGLDHHIWIDRVNHDTYGDEEMKVELDTNHMLWFSLDHLGE